MANPYQRDDIELQPSRVKGQKVSIASFQGEYNEENTSVTRGQKAQRSMINQIFQEIRQSVDANLDQNQEVRNTRASQMGTLITEEQKTLQAGKRSIYAGQDQTKPQSEDVRADKDNPAGRKVYEQKIAKTAEELRQWDEHQVSLEELFERLQSNPNTGLTTQQAEERNKTLGLNKLPEKKKMPAWIKFLLELTNWFAIMLWVGGGLCIMAYFLQPSQGMSIIYLSIVLFFVVILTGGITYMQTAKSDALMESFKNFLPPQCSVVRDGYKQKVDAVYLTPGDIVDLNLGDKVPADVRILESNELKVDNSPLTGESDPLLRRAECTNKDPLETDNLAFFGTLIKEGQGRGVVVRIGENTILGQIANAAESGEKVKTPLRIELDRFVLMITVIAIVLGVAFFFSAKYRVGYTWVDCIVFGIGILVANVPEGLLGCITISLAITASRLHEKQVLVKNLEGVETLGSTSCICSDKTGTLTQNKMTVEHLWYDDLIRDGLNRQKFGQKHDYDYSLEDPTFQVLHKACILSSKAFFLLDKDKQDEVIWLEAPVQGDASETALVKFFQPLEDIEVTRSSHNYAKTVDGLDASFPFNSKYKYAFTIVELPREDSHYCILIKGAAEKIWEMSTYVMKEGAAVKIDRQEQKKFDQVNAKFANNGERVLGFAIQPLLKEFHPKGFQFILGNPDKFNFKLKDLTFVALISLQDPPKDRVPGAVLKCRAAGIKVIMVTGDQPLTAAAIGKQVNIIPKDLKSNVDLMQEDETLTFEAANTMTNAIVIKGAQIEAAVEEELKQGCDDKDADQQIREWARKDYCVFARTTPQHKLRIVRACQRVGYIVGVTGDGVNDSPAIKQGDIGISMGITGSEVTKDAADMILLNDDFSSIVDGVEEGRKIFDNLKKTVVYLLTSNVTEIFPFLAQIAFLIPLPLSNMLMLVICVGTDILPALSLAYEAKEIDIMIRRPRTRQEHMVTRKLITHAYLQMGVISTGGGFLAFFVTMYYYGFSIPGMFGQQLGNLHAGKRCGLDPNSCLCNQTYVTQYMYNQTQDDLGNMWLFTDQENQNITDRALSDDMIDYLKNGCCKQDCSDENYYPLDWLYYGDLAYDLRYVFVEFEHHNNSWVQNGLVFRDCQLQPGTQYESFTDMKTKFQPDYSPAKYNYNVNLTANSEESPPVCYNTDALKYGQFAYFTAIVIAQWSNILACKSKKMSLIYSKWNQVMLYGIILETFLIIFLGYIPGVQIVFLSRPLNIWSWIPGTGFSMFLMGWVEFRKFLMLREKPLGQRNWFEFIADW